MEGLEQLRIEGGGMVNSESRMHVLRILVV